MKREKHVEKSREKCPVGVIGSDTSTPVQRRCSEAAIAGSLHRDKLLAALVAHIATADGGVAQCGAVQLAAVVRHHALAAVAQCKGQNRSLSSCAMSSKWLRSTRSSRSRRNMEASCRQQAGKGQAEAEADADADAGRRKAKREARGVEKK